jgi:hypothetical protein
MTGPTLNCNIDPSDIEDKYNGQETLLYDSTSFNNVYSKLKELLADEYVDEYITVYGGSYPDIEIGKVGIYDERGKCKDLNIIICDNDGNKYDFNWYGRTCVTKVWQAYTDDWYKDYIGPRKPKDIVKEAIKMCLEYPPDIITRRNF